MGGQFLWPGLCEEEPITLDLRARPPDSCPPQPRYHHLPPPQPLPPNLPLPPFSTCQASDEVLLWVPQEAGAAQSSFQPLPTSKDRLQRGRWLRREAEPSLPLQGTHEGPI